MSLNDKFTLLKHSILRKKSSCMQKLIFLEGEKSTIKKRYTHLTEEILRENPNMCAFTAPSLAARQEITAAEVPRLGREAAEKAIKEWGQPKSSITHLVFCSLHHRWGPHARLRLPAHQAPRPPPLRQAFHDVQPGLLRRSLRPPHGQGLGGSENNSGARVLVVCSEMTAMSFRGPSGTHMATLVEQALFADGAAAVVVGSDAAAGVERPLFQIISTAQTLLPESEGCIQGHLTDCGMMVELEKDVPELISKYIGASLSEAFDPLGISDWNSIFWIVHPGGRAILDDVEAELALEPEKLRLSRRVLSEYGNISSACVLFIMDEMRKSSAEEGLSSTGEGLDWGVMFGFGPGITVETVVLRSVAIT
ncbi:hypothetical protein ABFX02_07G059900 [Erythranthe guttata]